MRKLIAWVFTYSVDGFLADEGTPFWDDCFSRPADPRDTAHQIEMYETAHAHLMGRSAYEGMSAALPTSTDVPFAHAVNAGRKVVVSTTLGHADWANTTIARGDLRTEVDALRQGGDGQVIVWGGVRLWRSLTKLDLIDEWYLDLHPFVAGTGTRLFEEASTDYPLELVSSTGFDNGIVGLHLRRPR